MESRAREIINSGIEPVDKVLGGLEAGRLYLVHGEGSSKSLFGIKFLIEGLKRGQHAALVINYSPEDAVRRFARVGYDCLEDIYTGRLVILECAEDNIKQIARMSELTPVLRELRWLMGEASPERVVFEPIARLVLAEDGDTEKRAQEFAEWAGTTGATALLIANGEGQDAIRSLRPLVRESFRFEIREEGDRATRYLSFEKAGGVQDQPIEVDPTRGIFLLDRSQAKARGRWSETLNASAAAVRIEDEVTGQLPLPPGTFETPAEPSGAGAAPSNGIPPFDQAEGIAAMDAWFESTLEEAPESASELQERSGTGTIESEQLFDDLLEELINTEGETRNHGWDGRERSSPRVAMAVHAPAPAETSRAAAAQFHDTPRDIETPPPAVPMLSFDQDEEETPVSSARTALDLLEPPVAPGRGEFAATAPFGDGVVPLDQSASTEQEQTGASPDEFNVLVISGDGSSSHRISKALGEYHLEKAPDGLTGLAKLISFRADLIILDLDLQLIDGFKLLEHIRANLDVPIIVLSSSHVRASDRIKSAELGADYYLTKPFAIKELRQKARQLIARYRSIEEWITIPVSNVRAAEAYAPGVVPEAAEQSFGRRFHDRIAEEPGYQRGEDFAPGGPYARAVPATSPESHSGQSAVDDGSARSNYRRRRGDQPREPKALPNRVVSYDDFVSRVEQKVAESVEGDVRFSIVGCRLARLTGTGAAGGAKSVSELLPRMVRGTDVVSVNKTNDVVVLLLDVEAGGAQAFAARLKRRVIDETGQEPAVWSRSFPAS
ncbi:MAG TPA: response regulator [Blastocatellia bacterium]|nr:response regulator [Blastocatellia bacterium]